MLDSSGARVFNNVLTPHNVPLSGWTSMVTLNMVIVDMVTLDIDSFMFN